MHPKVRAALGPAYPVLMRAKGSRPVALARTLPGAAPYCLAALQGRPLAIDISSAVGLGALISHALLFHAYLERLGRPPLVRATGPLYSEGGADVFARFFHRPPWPEGLAPLGPAAREFVLMYKRPAHIPLAEAADLFARHFAPRPELLAVMDARFGAQRFDASVHFRGTDKFLESDPVGFAPILARIESELDGIPSPTIFLATDDAQFDAAIRRALPRASFASYTLGTVPDGVARHFSNLSPSDKALEALVNIFMIARAPVCIRTSSYLSAISTLAAPQMRTITAETPFPERELLRHEGRSA